MVTTETYPAAAVRLAGCLHIAARHWDALAGEDLEQWANTVDTIDTRLQAAIDATNTEPNREDTK